jgi:hypothetical protein
MPTNINFDKKLGFINGTSVVLPSGPGPAPFESTKSLFFDGVDEHIETSTTYSELDGGTKVTLSVWIKPISGPPILEYIISNPRNTTANQHQFSLTLYENNNVQFDVQAHNSQYVIGDINAITYGAWNHILVCVDLDRTTGTEGAIFINGVDETTISAMGTLSSFYTATDALHIGVDANGGYNRFNGNIDELAIWSGQDLRNDVATIYNNGKPADLSSLNPTSWYRAGENSTFASPQILMPENTNKNKVSNYSLDFANGFCYFITSSVFDVLDGASQVTISFWLNSPLFASTGEDILWIPITTTSRSLEIKLRSDGQIQVFVQNSSGGTSRVYSVVGYITANSWYHVMLTLDLTQPVGSKGKIFINGLDKTLAGQDTINITSITSAGDGMAIGANRLFGGFGAYYNGKLTQFAIWNNSNLQSQASAIYNSGTPTNISSLSPTVYYKLGEGTTFNTVWEETDSASSGFNLTGGPDFDRIEDRVGDAPNSENNALSINMEEADIVPDTP